MTIAQLCEAFSDLSVSLAVDGEATGKELHPDVPGYVREANPRSPARSSMVDAMISTEAVHMSCLVLSGVLMALVNVWPLSWSSTVLGFKVAL